MSALFLLFFAETKVLAGTLHSQGNFSSQTTIHNNSHYYYAGKFVETKISPYSQINIGKELNPIINQTEDSQSLAKQDLKTWTKLLKFVLVLTLLLNGLRKKHLFYNKPIKFSNCKYILLRTLRI